MPLLDEELAVLVQGGNKEAFEEIVGRYEKQLYHFALRLCRKKDLAEDIVQDSFLRAYQNIQSFDARKKFSSWIFRIVHNRAMDILRKEKKYLDIDIEDLPEIEDSKRLSEEIAKELDGLAVKQKMRTALEQVPVKYREVIILRYFHEMEYEEISDILKIPKNTVGTFLSRGKAALRETLSGKLTKEDI